MAITRRAALGAALLGAVAPARGHGQGAPALKLGVLTDLSGPYADLAGRGSVAATRQAVQEFGQRGFQVEIILADHQNKPDVASTITRQWLDQQGVDAVVDIPGSSAALAVANVVREKNKVFLGSAPGTAELTGKLCSPNTVQWTYDTYMLARSTGGAMVQSGGDSWYFVTTDYAFGTSMEAETARFVTAAGGTIVGSTRFPFPGTTDFSTYLLRAQASGAKVIGLSAGGADLINAVKQAAEFGLTRKGVRLAAMVMFISDVHALGLEVAQGLACSETFYWDLNDRTRAWTARWRVNGNTQVPTMVHAGCYGSVLHYLKAVGDMGVPAAKTSGADAVARMKAMPTDDDCFGPGRLREDGRKLTPAYLLEVKAPAESHGPWDYYKLLRTTPGDEAFRPLSEGGCPLVRG